MKMKKRKTRMSFIGQKRCCTISRVPIILTTVIMLSIPSFLYAKQNSGTLKLALQSVLQSKKIKGHVVDETGMPMIGVSIVVKGTSTGTITDLDGDFVLTVPTGKNELEITYIGYKPLSLTIGKSSDFKIKLEPDTKTLDEVVVIGYGVVKKKDLTGSVSSVKAEDIVKSPAANVMEALQGQIPGLDIVRNSGSATSGVTINIRGKRSLSSAKDENGNKVANAPLFIIDGMQGGNFEDVSPQDIESVEVMKDASSTAIYGSQGANGVIIITTKKGKQGKTKISYNGYYGINGWAQYPKMRMGDDYIKLRREAARTSGQWSSASDDQSLFTTEEWNAIQGNEWTDWVDEVVKTGTVQSHQISASGGTENTSAFFSAGYYQEKGAFKNDEMNKYNLRINVDHKMGKLLTVGTTAQITHYATDDRAANVLWRAATNVPLGKPYDESGNVNLWPLGLSGKVSPLADETDETTARHHNLITNVVANGYLEIKPMKGLSLRSNLGTNLNFRRNSNYEGANSIDRAGDYDVSTSNIQSSEKSFVGWDNILSYITRIDEHNLGFTALTSWTQSKYNVVYAEGSGQLIPSQLWYNLGGNSKDSYGVSSGFIQSQTFSYALRANYSYKGRYLFTASNRWDGASRLSADNKWAAFPSVALGWRVSDEAWMKNLKSISNLKVRLSWGLTGNSGISEYGTQSGLTAYTNSAFQDQGYTYYVYNTLIGNPNLGWEKSTTWNLGFDLGFLDNRISAVIDLYDTKTTDILLPRTLPTSMGSGNNTPFQIYENIGATNNRGVELTLNTVNFDTKSFKWNTTATFSANKEKITELIDGRDIVGNTPETESLLIGRPLNSFYTYKRLGIWQEDEAGEAAQYFKDASKTQPFKPGDIKVADLNADHVIDATNDVAYIGSTSPKWTMGFNNYLKYKDFDLNLYFIMRWGQMIAYDFTAAYDPSGKGNQPAYLNYWTPENPSNDFPRPDLTNFYNYVGYQSLNYIDGSYLKLKTLSLGYNVPKKLIEKFKVNNLRLYVTANNLFTVAKSHLIKDYDPERGGSAKAPLQRQFVFGINLDF
nr:TonB-dependent receptor [uncultured Bacteroides sp.]